MRCRQWWWSSRWLLSPASGRLRSLAIAAGTTAVAGALSACATREAEDVAQHKAAVSVGSDSAARGAVGSNSSPLVAPAAANAPKAEAVTVRRAGAEYEIEIQSKEGFSPRAFDPVLKIGEVETKKSRPSGTVGEYGIVFSLSEAQFQSLAEGAPVEVRFGPSDRAKRSFGVLQKNAVHAE